MSYVLLRAVAVMISYVLSLFAGIGLWTAIGVTLIAGLMRGFLGHLTVAAN